MGHWNYRVTYDDDVLPHYEIREVYYDDDGAVAGWTERPTAPFGENLDELRDDLAKMQAALDRPVLDITDEDNPFDVLIDPETGDEFHAKLRSQQDLDRDVTGG